MEGLKRQGDRVPGIGHRIKNKDNRDKRVQLLQEYANKFFPSTKYLQVREGGAASVAPCRG